MNMIACVDKNFGIGYKGDLLFNIPNDKKFFRDITVGKTVIMGSKTFESLPYMEALKDRVNIVVSKRYSGIKEVLIANPIDSALGMARFYDSTPDLSDTFIIGGEQVYNYFIGYSDVVYLTMVDSIEISDRYFPNLHSLDEWKCSSILDKGEFVDKKDGIVKRYEIRKYTRIL